MSRARIERRIPADAAAAIQRAAAYFTTVGYTTEPVTYGAAQLGYTKGAAGSGRLDEQPHTLRILNEGKSLVFEFSTGLGSSGNVTAAEQQALEQRVDASMRAGPSGASRVGCRFCGRIVDATAATCEGCGSADYV